MSRPSIGLYPALRTEVSAAVVLGVRLLALPHTDFERELRAAAETNPAFIARELPCCTRCGRSSASDICARCRHTTPAASRAELGDAPSVVSAWEELRRDLVAALPSRLAAAAMTVLAALDERGLLDQQALTALPADVRTTVVDALREVGPPGIGATNVEESLLFQLDTAPLDPAERALARLVLTEHAADLAQGGPAAAARAAGCSPDRLAALLARLARLLRPYPGLAHPASAVAAAHQPPAQLPDLIFERQGDGVAALVPECERWVVGVDDGYQQALESVAAGTDPDQLTNARDQLREARTLVDQVQRRWALLVRLGTLLATEHAAPLLAGSTAFAPLTQAAAATRLGVHDSTISRAVRHRTARLVDGQVVPLRRLFGAHHDVRAAVAELVRCDPRPSDREVAEKLTRQGFRITRRTVAKYRLTLLL